MKRTLFSIFAQRAWPLLGMAALALMVGRSEAANFVTKASQGSGLNWTASIWSNPPNATATAPTAGNTYQEIANGTGFGNNLNNTRIRNPATAGTQTFPGDSLTMDAHTEIRPKQAGAILNFPGVGGNPGLILNGGALGAGDTTIFEFSGIISVASDSLIAPGDNGLGGIIAGRGLKFSAALRGSGALILLQAPTNNIAVEVTSSANTYSGTWKVKSGYLKGTAAGSLGTGNSILIDPNFSVPTTLYASTNGATVLAAGPAVFEPNYDMSTVGTLTLANGGSMILHQNVSFSAASINGTGIRAGTYTYASISGSFPANFRGGGSGSLTVAPLAAPPAPVISAISGDGQVTLSWPQVLTSLGYVVYRAANSGGPYTAIANQSAEGYVDSGLVNGTTNYYVVTATNNIGASANSNEVQGHPNPVVVGLTATGGTGQVALAWSALAGTDSYNVYRSTTSGGPYSSIASAVVGTSYTDSTVANGTTYYYIVDGNFTGGGLSNPSTQASASTAPSAPVLTSATLWASTVARLTWTFSDPVIGGFSLERDSGSGFTEITTLAASVRSYTNSGLSASTAYSYRIRATNSTGFSPYSSTGPVTTPAVGYNVNFALTTAPIPAGYLQDTGNVYGTQGTYGWDRNVSADGRWRQSGVSPDVRYDTLVHMIKALPPAFWEISVPNGFYSVRIVGGDPTAVDSVFQYNVEGYDTGIYLPTATGNAYWADHTTNAYVTDGKLTIKSGSSSQTVANNNKINFIDIYPATPTPPTIGTPPQAQTVLQGRPFTLSVIMSGGSLPFWFRWFKDSMPIPNETNRTYSVAKMRDTDQANYYVEIYNPANPSIPILSDEVFVTYMADTVGPLVTSTYSFDGANIKVVWDEALDLATSTDPSNYHVTGGTVSAAQLLANGGASNIVVLTVTGLASSSYDVGVAGGHDIRDTFGNARTGDPLASGLVAFTGSGLTDDGVIGTAGDPLEPGSTTVGSVTIVAGGSDMWGSDDHFRYVYGQRTGDFDVKVRVSRLDARNQYSKAGLVVRQDLTSGSPNLHAILTPHDVALDGTTPIINEFEAGMRATQNGGSGDWGGRPTNCPPFTNAWIRIQRRGSTFKGYFSTNTATSWSQFATNSSSLPGTLYVGLGATAHNNGAGQTNTATFENYANIAPPSISTPPQSQIVLVGASVTFSVVATGDVPLTYQWRKNGVNIGGANSSSYNIPSAQNGDAASYDVVVTGELDSSTTSSAASLSVVTSPLSVQTNVNTTVTFAANAVGTGPFTYQWKKNGTDIGGQTAASLTLNNVQASDEGSYSAGVTNAAGGVVTTGAALSLYRDYGDAPDPTYPTLLANNGARHLIALGFYLGASVDSEADGQPNSTATGDDLAGTDDEDGVTFLSAVALGRTVRIQVVASAAGKLDAWIDFNANGSWAEVGEPIFTSQTLAAGVNNLTFVVPMTATVGNTFARFRFSTVGGLADVGEAADGEVEDYQVAIGAAIPPAITSQPASRTNCVGTSASFAVTVDGAPPVSYQWYYNTNTTITDATNATYTIGSVQTTDAGSYTVVVTDAAGSTTSADAFLTVHELTTATALANTSRCVGQSVTFSTVAGGTGPFTYTWRKGVTIVQGPDGNASYNIPSVVLADTGTYSVEVAGACNTVTNSAVLTVSETIAVAGPSNTTGCAGHPVTLTATVTGVSPVTFTWKKGLTIVQGPDTNNSYTIPSVTLANAGTYTVEAVGACNSVTNSAVLDVNEAIGATTTPVTATRCEGGSVTLSTTVTGSSEATYTLKHGNDVLATTLFQAPATLFVVVASVNLSDAGTYTVEVEGGCNSVTNTSTLTVYQTITLAGPANATRCQNQSVTFTATPTGVSPVTYTWKKGATIVQGPDGNNSYTIASVTLGSADTYYVEAVGFCNSVTNSATLTVNPLPTVSINSPSICPGSNATLTATTDAANASYFWTPGGSNTASIVVSPSSTTVYTCMVTNLDTGCTNSGSGTVTVLPVTTAALSTDGGTNVCPGLTVILTATAGGTGPFSYTFRKNGVPVDGSQPQAGNTYTLTGVTTADTATYSVDIAGLCTTASATGAVSVVTPPLITANPQSVNGFYGNNATFSVTATSGAPQTYQWFSNNVVIANATNSSFTLTNLQCSYSASYSVTVSNCAGTTPSLAAVLVVQPSSSVYFEFNSVPQWSNNFIVSVPGLRPANFTYTNILTTGVGSSGAVDFGGAAGGTDSTAVFMNNAYDFSYNGAVLNISMMFKVKAPTANNRVLQLGFLNRPSTLTGERLTAFMSVRASSTNQPALGYAIQSQSKVNVGSGTIDGTVLGTNVALVAGNWYRLSCTFTNIKGTTANSYVAAGVIDDFGASGTSLVGTFLRMPATTVANADMVNDSSVFAGFRGFDNAGADAYDNLAVWINSGTVRFSCDPTNQTVLQGRPYVIRAFVDGTPPFTYQWNSNGVAIPGATDWQITNSAASLTDAASYTLTVNGTVTSAAGVLTVLPDTQGPSLVSVGSFDGWNIGATFNEKVDPVSATDPNSYTISGGLTVASATIRPDRQSVTLGLNGTLPASYTVTANVKDLFNNSGSSTRSGTVNSAGLTLADINNPIPKGKVYSSGDGEYEITAGGQDVWGGSGGAPYGDQFSFAYLQKAGDFDVRVAITNETYNIGNGGQITKAGILARDSLDPGSRNIDSYVMPAWPGLNRYEAGLRSVLGGNSGGWGIAGDPSNQGNVAANHPISWIRLRRINDTFASYTSADGSNWTINALTTTTFSNSVYLGLMMCAHNTDFNSATILTNFSSTALFKAFGNTPGYPTATINITTDLKPATTNITAFQTVTFTNGVTVSGAPATELAYVWQRSDGSGGFTNIPGANAASSTYTTPALPSSAAGSQWRCIVSVPGIAPVISSTATVAAIADATGPTITAAYMPTGAVQQVVVVFSEPVAVGSADVAANYTVTNSSLTSLGVNSATFYGSDGQTILLTLNTAIGSSLTNGVVVNNVLDRSAGANPIAANSFRQFVNLPLFSFNGTTPGTASNVVIERFNDLSAAVRDSGAGSAPRQTVDFLRKEPKFINNAPDVIMYTNNFIQGTTNLANLVGDNLGARITSYFVPPITGVYRFYIRSDDGSELWMNTNSAAVSTDPAGKALIAQQNLVSNPAGYAVANTASAPVGNVSVGIPLNQGQKYYMEGLYKEGIGGEGFAMAVREAADASVPQLSEVATGFVYFALPTGPAAVTTINPTSITVNENDYATFSVSGISGAVPYKFQWFQGANLVPQQTAFSFQAGPFALSDSAVTFVVSNLFSRAVISAAVTVTPDGTAPTAIRAVGDLNFTNVTISFSERVTEATATNTANYSIPGLVVLGATLQANRSNVLLRTSTQTQGQVYTITMNNIQDRAATPNTIAANSTVSFTAWVESFSSIKVELFLNLNAIPNARTTVPDLLVEPKFINNQPDLVIWTNIFAWNQNIGSSGRDNYGGRITAYFVPPRNGVYRFFIRSDDLSELRMNPCGTDPSQKIVIAEQDVACCKNYGDLSGGPNVSAGYPLAGGQKYYMEALFKEGIGGDGFTMAWRESNDSSIPPNAEAASAINFASVDNGDTIVGAVGIAQNPVDAGTVQEYHTATFTALATNTGTFNLSYQWLKNGIPIPLANSASYTTPPLRLADDFSLYSVRATIPGHAAYSAAATVHVVPDPDGPILAAGYGDPIPTHVRVVFSEVVAALGANNKNNYTFSGGTTVTNAALLADGKTVILALDTQITPGMYTVTAANIFDLAGNALAGPTTPSFSAPWVCTNNVVLREEFFGNATALPYNFSTLTNNPTFPNNPGYVDYLLAGFNSPQTSPNVENFSTRVTGFLLPAVSGNYFFQVHADDSGWMLISQDAGAENKLTLIRAEGSCAACNNPQNGPVTLTAGYAYYIEGLMMEGAGGDYIDISWKPPGAGAFTIIPAANLAYCLNPDTVNLAITLQPTNQTVMERRTATFTAAATGTGRIFYQWQFFDTGIGDWVNVPNATNSTLRVTPTDSVTQNGTMYRLFTSLGSGLVERTAISDPATLFVDDDAVAPVPVRVYSLSGKTIKLVFNEDLDYATATDWGGSYGAIGGSFAVGAVLMADNAGVSNTVLLSLDTELTSSTFTISGTMVDGGGNTGPFSANGNVFAPGTWLIDDGPVGTALDPIEKGSSEVPDPNRLVVVAGGSDIWNTADGFRYAWGTYTNDFDVKVRISRIDPRSRWSKAGFVVRESFAANGRHLNTVLTPAPATALDGSGATANDYEAGYRPTDGAGITDWGNWVGSRPTNTPPYTNAWMRLRRFGNTFTAFLGTNGVDWTQFATTNQPFTSVIYFGLATTAHNNGGGMTTTAEYNNFGLILPPTIVTPPQNQIVGQGNPATFNVVVSGEAPFTYQWRKGGSPIGGANGSSYTIINAQPSDEGDYDVIVSNLVGTATSTSAHLTVVLPTSVIVTASSYSGDQFSASVQTQVGLTYKLQYKDALTDPTWITVATVTGDGTIKSLVDPGPLPPVRFYQVKIE